MVKESNNFLEENYLVFILKFLYFKNNTINLNFIYSYLLILKQLHHYNKINFLNKFQFLLYY